MRAPTGSPGIENIVRKGRKAVDAGSATRLETLRVQYVPIESISPNEYNPNRQNDRDFGLLLRSMREDGFTQPIIVHADSSQIVDGEHRWRAAREIGLEEIPVVFVEMTAEQMRVATLRHNRARGSEDAELAGDVLRDLRQLGALDWAQDALLYDEKELTAILDDVDAAEALAADSFNEAWAPTRAKVEDADGDYGRESLSDNARARNQATLDKLTAAKTDGERQVIEREARKEAYRLVLLFRAEDAEVVEQVMEPRPAQRLLEMCCAHLGRDPETLELLEG